MSKLPAIQFYPADWRKDPAVQCLSYHDRGIWFEIICLMHESERRGVLLLNGRAMTDEMLGRILGLDNQTLNQTLTTLLTYGVASREPETGALMNRRMVRDEELRGKRTEAGKKGGNPRLVNQKSNQTPTTLDKQKSTPSSSSSTSSSSSEVKGGATPPPPSIGANGEFMIATNLLQELRLAAAPRDLSIVAQVIALEAKEHGGEIQAAEYIIDRATEAQKRGEHITVFWIKDRKFATTGDSHGTRQQRYPLSKGDINQRAFDEFAASLTPPAPAGQDAPGARRVPAGHPVVIDAQDVRAGH